jgi:hypothetical protein
MGKAWSIGLSPTGELDLWKEREDVDEHQAILQSKEAR